VMRGGSVADTPQFSRTHGSEVEKRVKEGGREKILFRTKSIKYKKKIAPNALFNLKKTRTGPTGT